VPVRRYMTMMPTTLVLPAAVPPGIVGVLIDPSVVFALLASLALAGTVALCIPLVRDARASRRKPEIVVVRRERLAA
jgi:hypothetical protein